MAKMKFPVELVVLIGTVLTKINPFHIFGKRPYILWYYQDKIPVKQGGPFSERQCKIERDKLIALGMKPDRFVILRAGVTPPILGAGK
jgi:hypothetical protein